MRTVSWAILGLSLASSAHAQNLLVDGDFNSGSTCWQNVALASMNVVASDGTPAPSVDLTTSTSGASGQGLYQCISVTAGASYRIGASVKRTSSAPTAISTVGIAVAFYGPPYCGVGSPLGGSGAVSDPDVLAVGTWTALHASNIVAPPGATFALVGVGANNANAGSYTFRVDSAFFGPNEYIFGNGFDVPPTCT